MCKSCFVGARTTSLDFLVQSFLLLFYSGPFSAPAFILSFVHPPLTASPDELRCWGGVVGVFLFLARVHHVGQTVATVLPKP